MDGSGLMLYTAAHELTHFIRDWSPAKFRVLASFLMEEYGKRGVSVDTLVKEQIDKAERNKREISYEEAFEEVVADSMETMLSDGKVMEKLARLNQKDSTLVQKIKNCIDDLAAKIRKAYKRVNPDSAEGRFVGQMKDSIERIQELFTEALVDAGENYRASAVKENTTQEGGVKYQVRSASGNDVVWIENTGFTNAQLKDPNVIAQYIATHIRDVYTIIESGQSVYIGKDLPGEYTHSKYTSYLQKKAPALLKAKNKATPGLGEMIEIATNRRWEPTKHKASKDAKYGMYRYDTHFAFPIKDQNGNIVTVKAFDAELLIRNASDGKKYLYDIVGIKENTANALDLRHKEARKGSYQAATQSSVSSPKVTQNPAGVKGKNNTNSFRDTEAGRKNDVLQKENTKLKEDVAELKKLLKLQKSLTHGTMFTKSSVESVAKLLMESANAKGDRKALAKLLDDFYGYIAKGEELTWEGVVEAAQPAVQWLQEHEQVKKQLDDYAVDILRELRSSRIYLDDTQKAEAAHQQGSFGEYRKRLMGSITIVKEGSVSLDSKWAELSQMYPDVFDPEISASDMPAALLDVVDRLRNKDRRKFCVNDKE